MPDVTKLVNATELDSNLTSVANAIRAKSGGSGTLAFPNGFVSEIQSIPTGSEKPTLKNPSVNYTFNQTISDNTVNGEFTEYYDFYNTANDALLGSIPANNGWGVRITEEYIDIPVGSVSCRIKSRSTLFNDSTGIIQTISCYGITYSLSNCSQITTITKFLKNDFVVKLEPAQGYKFPDTITIKNLWTQYPYTATIAHGVVTALSSQYGTTGFRAIYNKYTGEISFTMGSGVNNIEIICSGETGSGQNVKIEYTETGYQGGGMRVRQTNASGNVLAEIYGSGTVYFIGSGTIYIEPIDFEYMSGTIIYAGTTYDFNDGGYALTLNGTELIEVTFDFYD